MKQGEQSRQLFGRTSSQKRRIIFCCLPTTSVVILFLCISTFLSIIPKGASSTHSGSASVAAATPPPPTAFSSFHPHQSLAVSSSPSSKKSNIQMMSGAGPVLGVKGLSTWAVVGDVFNTAKPAYRVAQRIESSGRTTFRVSPYAKPDRLSSEVRTYKKFQDIPMDTHIDADNLIVSPRIGVQVLEEMAKRHIQYCFIQPGADGGDVLTKAEELGITVQQGCVLVQPLPPLDE